MNASWGSIPARCLLNPGSRVISWFNDGSTSSAIAARRRVTRAIEPTESCSAGRRASKLATAERV